MGWKSIFVGPAGLRAGWRIALFVVIAGTLAWGLPTLVVQAGYVPSKGFDPVDFFLSDGLGFVALLVGSAVMARIERRKIREYGLPLSPGLFSRYLEGLVWGTVSVLVVAAGMAALGGFSVAGLARHGVTLAFSAILWAVTMTILGLFEEFFFRGYLQHALASGIGFWPAAVAISLFFGLLHYFTKPRETLVDAATITFIGLLLCLMLARTGDLWMAVGYHAAFDYVALVVLASPNTGMPAGERAVGHLLETSFPGPAWLTGGDCGLEASLLMFPMLALSFFLFSRLHPARSAGGRRVGSAA
jgi:hypothetical protein